MNPATGQPLEAALNPARARPGVYRLDARAILDANGLLLSPGSVLLEVEPTTAASPSTLPIAAGGPLVRGRAVVLAVDTPAQIDTHPLARSAHRLSMPDSVLLPPFVNAHAHLDLTHIGPRPYDPAAGFVGFVDLVRSNRCDADEAIRYPVVAGIALSLRAGVVAVGDIAGAPRGEPRLAPLLAMAHSPIRGVSFLEFFGIGLGEQRGHERMDQIVARVEELTGPTFMYEGVRIGLQPHAPNTIAKRLYAHAARAAVAKSIPICTHLAETPEERAFVGQARGPQRELLERLGVWHDGILQDLGHGRSPIAHLDEVLDRAPWLAVHVNDCSDADLDILARARPRLVYCPRASAYFGAERHFGPHRYRDFMAAGLTVALGTDSVINMPPGSETADGPGLSILEEMRFLYARDHADPLTLLVMGTTHGARALGLDESLFIWKAGSEIAGLIAIDLPERRSPGSPWTEILQSKGNPRLLFVGK